MAARVTCPAAELQHPVLSPNDDDVECRIAGRLQPAPGSPCVGDYSRCQIWRAHKENEWANSSRHVDEAQRARAKHTVSATGKDRDSIRA